MLTSMFVLHDALDINLRTNGQLVKLIRHLFFLSKILDLSFIDGKKIGVRRVLLYSGLTQLKKNYLKSNGLSNTCSQYEKD